MDVASEALLGPRWAPKELRTFYILLKVHGEQWDKLGERLPGRTVAMVRGLFDMHRRYLALPEASAEGFCAVMMDHYKAQDERAAAAALSSHSAGAESDANADRGTENAASDANRGLGKREDAASAREGQTPKSRKKRRLEKLLSLDGADQLEPTALEQLRIWSESDTDMPEAGEQRPTKRSGRTRRAKATPRPARWWLQDASFDEVRGQRFDLPWFCWFYSCDDDAFFRHNEFVECLDRMGLGKIKAAARPIWSSVRLSMGHPRRLSPLFFAQEKMKLEEFRKLRQRTDPKQIRSRSWPFLRPVQLNSGTKVIGECIGNERRSNNYVITVVMAVASIVWMEMYQRFLMGTVVSASTEEGVCTVVATTSGSDGSSVVEARLLCPLRSVMALDFLQPNVVEKDLEPQAPASLLRRADSRKKRSQATLATPPSQLSSASFTTYVAREDGDFRENRLRVIMAVKDLLQRKEQILSGMAKLNSQAAKLQHESLKANGLDKSQLWTTPTSFSSAALKDASWAHAGVRKALQDQHAWLEQNLSVTDKHLKVALLQLNSFAATPEDANSTDVSDADQTLSVDEMRWAIQFLKDSQRRAATFVDKTAHQTAGSAAEPPATPQGALPQTKQLISACLCLMSVFKAAARSDFAASVPPVVLHKLISRMVELLKPSHGDNMDLYAELKTMADGVQAQLAFQNAPR